MNSTCHGVGTPVPGQERRRAPKGFTLIELLVVIAIIALLIGILLPALGKARKSAQEAKNLSNLKGMGLVMNLYANDSKGWFPLIPFSTQARAAFYDPNPNNRRLDFTWVAGGVAGFFSLYQVGDGQTFGYRGTTGNEDQSAYPDGNKTPLLSNYMDNFQILVSPADKIDYAVVRGGGGGEVVDPAPASVSEANSRPKVPKAPGGRYDVVSYNISYMYIAGMKLDEPNIITAVPFWGDETNAPDTSTRAWYGAGLATNPLFQKEGAVSGGYAKNDNQGKEGGSFVFTDGHAAFIPSRPPEDSIFEVFYGTNTNRHPTSVNAIDRNRSRMIQTMD